MNLENFLREILVERKVILIGDDGIEYTFDAHEPIHESKSFCFASKEYGVSQFEYDRLRYWKVKEG